MPEIELNEVVVEAPGQYEAKSRVLRDLFHACCGNLLEKIRFAAEKSGERGVAVGSNGHDHPIEIWPSSVVGGICCNFESGAGIPAHESEAAYSVVLAGDSR